MNSREFMGFNAIDWCKFHQSLEPHLPLTSGYVLRHETMVDPRS